jgi:hypothetical protein
MEFMNDFPEFTTWLKEYKTTANYFVAKSESLVPGPHALDVCLAYAWLNGRVAGLKFSENALGGVLKNGS